MSYKLKPTETFAEGFERVATEEVERALACLRPDMDVHKGAHEARKAMKRLRALLALYRGALRAQDYRALNQRCRQVGHALAGTREIQALLDSVTHLAEHYGDIGHNSALGTLKAQLAERHAEVQTGACRQNGHAADLTGELRAIAARVGRVEVRSAGFRAVRPGLVEVYRAARDLREEAYALDTGEAFHEWRKALQRHWRHLQLLTAGWPHELRGRAQLVRQVAETIGQDHDLTMLSAYLDRNRRKLGGLAQIRSAQALCRERQGELRNAVHQDSQHLFAERPKAFADRLERYWEIAVEQRSDAENAEPAAT